MADIFGTSGNDTLDGTIGDDTIWGLEGNDTINGGNGNDLIYGGPGADIVKGGGGDDTYSLQVFDEFSPGDSFDGGAGYDTLMIDVDVAGFDLSSLSYSHVEALVATTISFGLGVTAAQLNAFQSIKGYFRVLNSGAVTISGPTLQDGTTFSLGSGVTNFTFTGASGAAIRVEGNAGANVITGSASTDTLTGAEGADQLFGGNGNDVLFGDDGNDVLVGGTGNDVLSGGRDVDSLDGGDGNDSFLFLEGPDGDAPVIGAGDTVIGGLGTDTLIFQIATTGGSTMSFAAMSGIERILSVGWTSLNLTTTQLSGVTELGGYLGFIGTGAVTLGPVTLLSGNIDLGTTAPWYNILTLPDPEIRLGDGVTSFNFTAATYGKVSVWAGANATTIVAGNGTNTIYGSSGGDTITGGTGDDRVEAGQGADAVYGGAGYDDLYGSDGDDQLYGGSENDHLYGGAGLDRLYGGDGTDFLSCGDLAAFTATSSVVAGEIYDGGAGYDTLILPGSLEAAAGTIDLTNVTLVSIEALEGSSVLTRINTAQFAGVQSVNGKFQLADNGSLSLAGVAWDSLEVQLSNGGQSLSLAGNNAPLGFAKVFGGTGNDSVTTGPGSAEIYGGDGNDVLTDSSAYLVWLNGDAGNDRLVTNGGAYINGGSGFDTLVANGAVSVLSLAGIEAIEFTAGANLTLSASQVASGLALNTLLSGTGTLTINLEAGVTTTMTGFQGAGAPINVVVNGSSGDDFIKASHFNNNITGGLGRDFIRGGNGVDTIDGGADNDKITGWGGADILTGGGGADQFRYLVATDSGVGAAADRITDFAIGSDTIDLRLLDSDLVTSDIQNYSLSFIGTAAFGAGGAGQIRTVTSGSDMLVQFDLDGNGTSDMEILLQSLAGQTLSASDFLGLTTSTGGSEPLSGLAVSEPASMPASALLPSDPLSDASRGLLSVTLEATPAMVDLLDPQHVFAQPQHGELLHLV